MDPSARLIQERRDSELVLLVARRRPLFLASAATAFLYGLVDWAFVGHDSAALFATRGLLSVSLLLAGLGLPGRRAETIRAGYLALAVAVTGSLALIIALTGFERSLYLPILGAVPLVFAIALPGEPRVTVLSALVALSCALAFVAARGQMTEAAGWVVISAMTGGIAVYSALEESRGRATRHQLLIQQAQMSHQLRESQERLAAAFAMSPDAIVVINLNNLTYVSVNPAFTRMTGWSEAEAVGRTAPQLGLVPMKGLREALESLSAGELHAVEYPVRARDGRELKTSICARKVMVGGEPLVLSFVHDVTAERRTEEQLRQAQKMEAVGQLAGGMAHDFNNLLTVILAHAELELTQQGPGSEESWTAVRQSAERGAALIRQLLAFSRKQRLAPRALELNEQLTALHKMLQRLLGEDLKLAIALTPTPAVMADTGQVEQAVINLVLNARDAVKPGGKIELGTGVRTMLPADATDERPAGDYAMVSVRDDGTGMSPEVQARIFEPFFTTKPVGQGTGLGLATVYGIARQHKGFVEVESALGRGTTFKLYFPLAVRRAETAQPPLVVTRPGRGRVLLVEDEAAVRNATRAVLESLGYEVRPAPDANEALAQLEQGQVFDVVLSDVVMPGLDGFALATRVAQLRPGLPVVLVSGYSQEAIAKRGNLPEGLWLLEKPFDRARLSAVLHEVRTVKSERPSNP
ncbi:MAG: response regulator [Myxococcaceae bacterium]